MKRGVLSAVLAALVLNVTPSLAAPPLPVISDGFTMSGRAGAQARVRLDRPVRLPDVYRDNPRLDLRASSGAVAGYALVPRTERSDKFGNYAYAVETTRPWTCGTVGCASGSKLRYSLVFDEKSTLPAGEYVLVLIGSPGARIDLTLHPSAKNARPRRIVPTATLAPVVEPTEDIVPSTGADAVATGSFTVDQRSARALVGVVHSIAIQGGTSLEYGLDIGSPGAVPLSCGGWTWGGSRSAGVPPLHTPFHYSFTGLFESFGTGERCARWEGRSRAPLTTQRGLGLYVPLRY